MSKIETDGEILARLGDDARKWAKEFNKTAVELGYSNMDEGWLIAWFASAIEYSHDLRRWKAEEKKRKNGRKTYKEVFSVI